jgi:hypothetical protein
MPAVNTQNDLDVFLRAQTSTIKEDAFCDICGGQMKPVNKVTKKPRLLRISLPRPQDETISESAQRAKSMDYEISRTVDFGGISYRLFSVVYMQISVRKDSPFYHYVSHSLLDGVWCLYDGLTEVGPNLIPLMTERDEKNLKESQRCTPYHYFGFPEGRQWTNARASFAQSLHKFHHWAQAVLYLPEDKLE